jgi:hypothetical protein
MIPQQFMGLRMDFLLVGIVMTIRCAMMST